MADWDVTLPIDHTTIGDIPGEIRDVTSSAKEIISKEHVNPATSNAGGQHLKGSARVYLDSAAPAVDPEGNGLDTSATSDDGRIAVLTGSNNLLRVYIATSAGISTGFERLAVQSLQADTDCSMGSRVLADVAAATQTGQAMHVGQLDTSTFSIATTDGNVQVQMIGATVSTDSGGLPLIAGSTYKAQCDGFVSAYADANVLVLYADTFTIPTTIRQGADPPDHGSVGWMLAKDNYVKMTGTDIQTYNWTPFGTGGLVAQ